MEKIWLAHYPPEVQPTIDSNRYASVFEIFEEAAKKFGPKPAFTNLKTTLSFDELAKKVDQFASFLQNELGMKTGDRIAIQMPNLLQFPVAAFAALKIGLIVVNTNPLYTAKEMRHQFKDSGAKCVVILANFAGQLQEILHETEIESVIVTEVGDLCHFPKSLIVNAVVRYVKKMVPPYHLPKAYTFRQALQLGSARPANKAQVQADDTAFLQYTGGTTGVAKGAILSHRNICSNMQQIAEWMRPLLREGEETALTALPMYHIFSLTVNCLAFMHYGARNLLITNPKDIPAFIAEMRGTRFTIMSGVNTLFNALMNHPDFNKIDFSGLKVGVAGAMALQSSVSERWRRLTKSVLVEGYGLTEASPVISCNPINGTDRTGTIGLPLPSTEIRLIDDEGKEVTGENVPGELCARGPQVMKGYWNQPEETSKVLDADGWLKTGDVAVHDSNGFYKIVDRKKDMIIVSGFNVYPNEVEDAIASHPGVLEVAAIGIPNEPSGEIVKVVIVKKDPTLTDKEVIEYARKSLTGYKVPKLVEFRTELPKTAVGKILRRALRDPKPGA